MEGLEQLANAVTRAFATIEQAQMAGIPLLNPALRVQTLGFQIYQGRCLGVVITPWMMSLLLFPGEQDGWSELELGEKRVHRFPSNTYEFLVNRFDDLGVCQTYSLRSPMREFSDQEQAVAVAEDFLAHLMVPVDMPPVDSRDEALLGRILEGEAPLDAAFDGLGAGPLRPDIAESGPPPATKSEPISRRELLRGRLRRGQ